MTVLSFTVVWGVLSGFVLMTSAAPVADMTRDKALSYFEHFRYTGKDAPDPRLGALMEDNPEEALYEACMAFQLKWNLTATGTLTEETVELMEMPRCGMPDIYTMEDLPMSNGDSSGRTRRFVLQGSKWDTNDLTYKISQYTNDMSRSDVDSEIARAFQVWEDVTPLRFSRRTSGDVDIEIIFVSGDHSDGFPFDGRGQTLAHAFFPQFGGDAHFDDAEAFTLRMFSGINLFQVAAHEFGHALGLSHSEIQAALMAPFYQGYQQDFTLHQDDVAGIQAIYGENPRDEATTTTTTAAGPTTTSAPGVTVPTTTTRRPNQPPICTDGTFDAITNHTEGDETITYGFRGDMFVRINADGIAPGYPRTIASEWAGLPNDLDAALFWPAERSLVRVNGRYRWLVTAPARTYFFKGSQYWRFENKTLVSDYPRAIKVGFRGLPDNIDAAFVWGRNDRTYFTKGAEYYRYTRGGGVDRSYPRPLSVWEGLPAKVDAAVQYKNGLTYFFDGPNYYRFDDDTFMVATDYPRLNSIWWLGCNSLHVANQDGDDDSSAASKVSMSAVALLVTLLIKSVQ